MPDAQMSWEAPPPSSDRMATEPSLHWKLVIQALQARPGQWAKLPGLYTRHQAKDLRRGRLGTKHLGDGSLDVRSQIADPRVYKSGEPKRVIWARYMGPDDGPYEPSRDEE